MRKSKYFRIRTRKFLVSLAALFLVVGVLQPMLFTSSTQVYAADITPEEAVALKQAKEAAQLTIASSELSTADKSLYADRVMNAKSIAEVDAILADVDAKNPTNRLPLYRAYNPNSGAHFYTANSYEFLSIVKLGWQDEGMAWTASKKGTPIYRAYNPNSGEHIFTVNTYEYDNLVAHGWQGENIAFYSNTAKSVNVYRLYNPNEKRAGSHLYTTNLNEYNELVRVGWRGEGIVFYAM